MSPKVVSVVFAFRDPVRFRINGREWLQSAVDEALNLSAGMPMTVTFSISITGCSSIETTLVAKENERFI
jgi:hypothetical protein